jgi:hypothetical protein
MISPSVVNELKTDKLECSINGSGTINLKAGNAEEADYSITTDGEIMAFGVAPAQIFRMLRHAA